jgi:hypothetical protein
MKQNQRKQNKGTNTKQHTQHYYKNKGETNQRNEQDTTYTTLVQI